MASQKMRQKLLDYINQNPRCTPSEAGKSLGMTTDIAGRAMTQMFDSGEVYREKSMDENGQPYRYEALVKVAEKRQLTRGEGAEFADKYDQTSRIRQEILDLANKTGRITNKLITETILFNGRAITCDHASRTANRMAVDGELHKHGRLSGIFYTPLKTQTMSAEALRERQTTRKGQTLRMPMPELDVVTTQIRPGHIRHCGMNRVKPLPFQEGQGSHRRIGHIQSVAATLD